MMHRPVRYGDLIARELGSEKMMERMTNYLLSTRPRSDEEIADEIASGYHRGVTVLNGKGWFSKEDAHVLMVLTRKVDLNPLLRSIKAIDPNAFISVSSVTGVYGKGFDAIKTVEKKGSKSAKKL